MIKSVISFVLAALLLPGMPSVSWKAQINPVQDNQYQVVVTGTIAPDYYVHPMGDPFVGTLLSVEEGEVLCIISSNKFNEDAVGMKFLIFSLLFKS